MCEALVQLEPPTEAGMVRMWECKVSGGPHSSQHLLIMVGRRIDETTIRVCWTDVWRTCEHCFGLYFPMLFSGTLCKKKSLTSKSIKDLSAKNIFKELPRHFLLIPQEPSQVFIENPSMPHQKQKVLFPALVL